MGTVRVRLFARLADLAGTREAEIDLGEGFSAADVLTVLARAHPELAGFGATVRFAVNADYVPGTHPLSDGDEVALIPPVSGGSHAV